MIGRRPKLPGLGDRVQDPAAKSRRCGLGGGDTEPGRGLGHAPHLAGALLAPAQVALEAPQLSLVVDGVYGICASQDVHGGSQGRPHHVTPMQSRSLIRPSRILVLIVPSVIPSSPATSR